MRNPYDIEAEANLFAKAIASGDELKITYSLAGFLVSAVTDLRRIADAQEKIAEEMERISVSASGASEEYFRQTRGG